VEPLTTSTSKAAPDERDDSSLAEAELLSPIEVVLRNQVLAQHALVMEGDYFQILGISPTATRQDIEQAHAAVLAIFSAPASSATSSATSSPSSSDVSAGWALSEELRRGLATQLEDIRAVVDEAARLLGNAALRAKYQAHRPPPPRDSGER
jgi:hypothetical protein